MCDAVFSSLSGSLIEYAVILFKKQKKCKYGAPSQSAYPHSSTVAAQAQARWVGWLVGGKLFFSDSSNNSFFSTYSVSIENQVVCEIIKLPS